MSTITHHTKVTMYEVYKITQNFNEYMGYPPIDQEELIKIVKDCKPTDFKPPRKQRTSKSSEERHSEEYNPSLCDARVFGKGFGVQCSRKKSADNCLCTIHQRVFENNSNTLKEGFITGDRPTHHFNDTTKPRIPWNDLKSTETPTDSDKPKKRKSSKPRICGKCKQPGHNARTCKADTLPLCLPCQDDGSGVGLPRPDVTVDPDVDASILPNNDNPQVNTARPTTTEEFSQARIALQENLTSNPSDQVVQAQADRLQSLQSNTTPVVEQEPTTSPQPDLEADTEEEDDSDSTTPFTFEDVLYTHDNDNIVYDDDGDEVGTWDGTNITFSDKQSEKAHNLRRSALQ